MPARIIFSAHGGEPPERRLPSVVTLRSTFATLVLVVAVVGGLVGVMESNPRHSLSTAAAATPPTASSTTSSLSSTATSGAPTSAAGGSARRAPGSSAGPTDAHAVSQGQVGVIPVPLAPKAEAGPIPLLAWQAYHRAAAASGCQLPWYLLAGIGKVESDHGRFHGAQYDVTGTVHPAIFGPPTAYGRAMGPMQFIPPTWSSYGIDGNHDGKIDPQNVFDATAAAAHYLCIAGGPDLSGLPAQRRAVFAYNHLDSYVADVLAFAAAYEHGQPERTVHLVPITNPKPAAKTAPTTRSTTSAATVKTPKTSTAPATTTSSSRGTTSSRATTATSTPPTRTTSTSASPTSPPTTTPTTGPTTGPTIGPTTTAPACPTASTTASTSASSASSTSCPPCPTATASSPSTSAPGSPRSSPSTAATCVPPTPTPTSLTPRVLGGGRLTPAPSAT